MFSSDLNVYRFVKIKYLRGCVVNSHSHKFFHYFYILSGSGYITIDSTTYEVNKGEFYLTPVGVKHSIKAKKDSDFHTVEIKFIPNKKSIVSSLNRLPHQIKNAAPNTDFVIKELIREATQRNFLYEDVINVKFTEIMLDLIRSNVDKTAKITHGNELYLKTDIKILEKIIAYINNNSDFSLKITDIAKHFGFSESYFCTFFKKSYGLSPGHYINNLKLRKAKEYILYSDLNMTQIASIMGFASIHYFSRFFKKMEGISPKEYRSKHKDNIFLELIDGVQDASKFKGYTFET